MKYILNEVTLKNITNKIDEGWSFGYAVSFFGIHRGNMKTMFKYNPGLEIARDYYNEKRNRKLTAEKHKKKSA